MQGFNYDTKSPFKISFTDSKARTASKGQQNFYYFSHYPETDNTELPCKIAAKKFSVQKMPLIFEKITLSKDYLHE